jgi:surfactin synthase thioesterase subunit/3-oxoacyl-(acyl-carrier-protein) synthase/acyl carrier protein
MTEQTTLQKALFTIKKMKAMLQDQQSYAEPIAIVGLSCRFPQAVGKDAYWRMLSEGKNVLGKIPEARWDLLKGSDEVLLRDPEHPYYGGYVENIDEFDAYFFGISPREAFRMDPQHRLLLEVAYEAIEDAGIAVENLAGSKTGVFSSLYVSQLAHMQTMENDMDALYLPTGNAISIAANRLSYLFDLRGPSIIIDSACSSSMAGLHIACQSIQSKACDLALVCGAKLNLLPYVNFVLSKAKMLSPNGQCRTFDAEADGYAQGEGVGVIVLKPLSKALEDNDRVYGVILGSAVNQDGKTNGLTAPNGLQQEDLLKTAYQKAKINPADISYVECHGTGTFLGDPIEIEALGKIVGKNRLESKPCYISSVKTNIGHLEPAAGVASVIKVALALRHQKIPPHLNFVTPNPHIPFSKYHLQIPQALQDWPVYGDYRLAASSGFGFGGTNAHVVIREILASEQPTTIAHAHATTEVFTLSAKDPAALRLMVGKWCEFIDGNPGLDLAAICHNMHLRRSHYFYRVAIVAKNMIDLYNLLLQVRDNTINSSQIFINIDKAKTQTKPIVPDYLESIDPLVLAKLYIEHAPINWRDYEGVRRYPHLDMPLYSWQHKVYWPKLGHHELPRSEANNSYPLRAQQVSSPLDVIQFEYKIDSRNIPDVEDTYNILHAGYYLEIISFAVNQLTQQQSFTLEDHKFMSPLIAPKNTVLMLQLVLTKQADGRYLYQYFSNGHEQKNWIEHAKGMLTLHAVDAVKVDTIVDIKKRCPLNEGAPELYSRVLAMGMPAGDSIRWTQQFWRNSNEILCEFKQPKFQDKNSLFTLLIHPSIVDASIQPIFKLLPDEFVKPYIASSAERIQFFGMQDGPYYLLGSLNELSPDANKITGNCWLMNASSQVIAEFKNICLTELDNKVQIADLMKAREQYNLDFEQLAEVERKPTIVNFLVDQIAIIFSMPKEDVEVERSLTDMGIDSLSALVLMRTLEVALHATFALQDLMAGPSISEIADIVLAAYTFSNTSDTTKLVVTEKNPWIAHRQIKPAAKMRLFCFPFGGGGASLYREWQAQLPDSIEVCPIQLPGREERLGEAPIAEINQLTDLLVENLCGDFDLPFAFFGHSFGSLIAFELTRKLRRETLPEPMHLFVSAFPDPRIPTKSLNVLLGQLQNIGVDLFTLTAADVNTMTDDKMRQLANIFGENGIAEYGDHLLNREVMKVLLPIFSGDMGIPKKYKFYKEEPLDLPITVFAGTRDNWVSYEDHKTWSEHTSSRCELVSFDSGHLFIKDVAIRNKVLAVISRQMLVMLNSQAAAVEVEAAL